MKKQIISLFMALLLVLSIVPMSVYAASTSGFTINFSRETIKAGETVSVTISVDETIPASENITNVQGELYYDTKVLTYVSNEMGAEYKDYLFKNNPDRARFQFSKNDLSLSAFEVLKGEVVTIQFIAKENMTEDLLTTTLTLKMKLSTAKAVTTETTTQEQLKICGKHDMSEASCTEPATCMHGCGYTEGEAKGHTEVVDKAVEPTYTKTGLTEGKHCSVCKKILVAQEVIAVKPFFADVSKDIYYYDAVLWAVEERITNGTTETLFQPEEGCTRAQVVTFLWRAAGEPTVNIDNPFQDVSQDAYYYDAVLWAVESGITNGKTKTMFEPEEECTRAQIVTFLWREAGKPTGNRNNPFKDIEQEAYYYDAVLWTVESGITNGKTATNFEPDQNCTRGQVVTFLYREAFHK